MGELFSIRYRRRQNAACLLDLTDPLRARISLAKFAPLGPHAFASEPNSNGLGCSVEEVSSATFFDARGFDDDGGAFADRL